MIIIDTREPSEYRQSHVDEAINIPPGEFLSGSLPDKLKNVNKDEKIILYCRTGQRSNTCGQVLTGYGFTNIVNGRSEGYVKTLRASEQS